MNEFDCLFFFLSFCVFLFGFVFITMSHVESQCLSLTKVDIMGLIASVPGMRGMAECHLFPWWKITLGPNNHGVEQHGSKYHAHGCRLFVLCKRGYKWISRLSFQAVLGWWGAG